MDSLIRPKSPKINLKKFKIFDYAGSSYDEFTTYLQKTLNELMAQSHYGIIAKSLIITSLGISPFVRWRGIITGKKVIDGEKKLMLVEYTFNIQEQLYLQLLNGNEIPETTKKFLMNAISMYYGKLYVEERTLTEDIKTEAFKEKFTLTIKGTGTLND